MVISMVLIQVEDIPEVATVANWITRYATTLKKLSAQKIEESIKNNLNDPAIIDVIDVNEGEKIGSSSIDIYEKDDSQRLSEESDVHFKGKKIFLNHDNSDNKHLVKHHKNHKYYSKNFITILLAIVLFL
ncbi:7723_t:CDS:2 [Entrophospora sp. SA101]|nr:7723_t:CDS:2 [Entrophospora sp. SA101]